MNFPNEILLEIMKFLDFQNCCKSSTLYYFMLTNKKIETVYTYWKNLNLLKMNNNYIIKLGNKMHPNGQIYFCHICSKFSEDEIRQINKLICDIKNKGRFKYYIDSDNKEKFIDKIQKCSDEFVITTDSIYMNNSSIGPFNRSVYIRLPFRY